MYKFAAADESEIIVFGAAKPGKSEQQVNQWIKFMKGQGIQRVCCLLAPVQLAPYANSLGLDLLEVYRKEFGEDKVCWAAIVDFQLADLATLTQKILPFLSDAYQQHEKVVVHCGGGIGRTGHVLAAWLVRSRGMSNKDAISAVKRTGRNPYEAAIASLFLWKNPGKVIQQLNSLLDSCR
ncbi:MAG: protein phosphatase [Methylacidiphilales bacterium]|nr:protein phosphatase [Candidatus Methylacidiphilales bacterium]NJR16593.1 protein phosphatase [Calothrix sp. CSU_2_0]